MRARGISRPLSKEARGANARTLLAAACLLLPGAHARPLPDKNELANSCYFTYRVGFIICDPGLSGAEAQEAMDNGKCNSDFRLLASDFQRHSVRYYGGRGRPPLEEAMWLVNSPDHFQSRTLRECPPMQVVAYALLAEAKLYLFGPEPNGPAAVLFAQAYQQAIGVPRDVYESLSRAWPMEVALQRFHYSFNQVQARVQQRSPSPGTPPYSVALVVCRCSQSLDWLGAHEVAADRAFTLYVYNTCGEGSGLSGDSAVAAAFGPAGLRAAFVSADGLSSPGGCSARTVVEHFALGIGADSEYTAFLPSEEPEEGAGRQLLEMVLRSLKMRTLDVDFLHLGMRRTAPRAPTGCERALWRVAFGDDLPSGYEGDQFLVSNQRLRQLPSGMFHRVLQAMGDASGVCDDAGLRNVFAPAWHAVLGEPAFQSLRSDDERLPVFLRFLDGPSGFRKTRLPKHSVYLAGVTLLQ